MIRVFQWDWVRVTRTEVDAYEWRWVRRRTGSQGCAESSECNSALDRTHSSAHELRTKLDSPPHPDPHPTDSQLTILIEFNPNHNPTIVQSLLRSEWVPCNRCGHCRTPHRHRDVRCHKDSPVCTALRQRVRLKVEQSACIVIIWQWCEGKRLRKNQQWRWGYLYNDRSYT